MAGLKRSAAPAYRQNRARRRLGLRRGPVAARARPDFPLGNLLGLGFGCAKTLVEVETPPRGPWSVISASLLSPTIGRPLLQHARQRFARPLVLLGTTELGDHFQKAGIVSPGIP